jgi:hypothetical protein
MGTAIHSRVHRGCAVLSACPGDRWFADETYVKVAAGGPICTGPSTSTARSSTCCSPPGVTWRGRFFTRALRPGTISAEVAFDQAAAYPRVLDELIPSALHTIERYANNPVEADHSRLKARLRSREVKAVDPRGPPPSGRTSRAACPARPAACRRLRSDGTRHYLAHSGILGCCS